MSGAKSRLSAWSLWPIIGIVCLLAYVWPLPNIQAQTNTTQAPSSQKATQPALTSSDSLKTKKAKIDNLDVIPESEIDPNQPPPSWITPSGDSTQVLDNFEYPKFLGSYPDDIWEGRSGLFYSKTDKKDVYYKIQKEDENHYLSAEIEGDAVNFGRDTKIKFRGRETNANLRLYQKLRWRWRVHSLPEGSDERKGKTNDSAAAVRLIFRLSISGGKAIKYIWSATLPVGTVIDDGGLKVIVLESGTEKLGQWVWEEVNVYEDYRRLFGGDPRPPEAIALLTDSNNTKSFAKADYDDITFIIPRPVKDEMVPDFMLDNP